MERVGPDGLPGLNPFMGTGNDVVQHAAATVTGSAKRKFQVPIPRLDALDYGDPLDAGKRRGSGWPPDNREAQLITMRVQVSSSSIALRASVTRVLRVRRVSDGGPGRAGRVIRRDLAEGYPAHFRGHCTVAVLQRDRGHLE